MFRLATLLSVITVAVPAFATSYLPSHVKAAGGGYAVAWETGPDPLLYVFSLRDGAMVRTLDVGGFAEEVLYNDALGSFWGGSVDSGVVSVWQWNPSGSRFRSERLPAGRIVNLLQEGRRRFVVYAAPEGDELMLAELGSDLRARVVSQWSDDSPSEAVAFLGDQVTSTGFPRFIDMRRATPLAVEPPKVATETVEGEIAVWVTARTQSEWLTCEGGRLTCFAAASPDASWVSRGKMPIEGEDVRLERLYRDPFDARAIYAIVYVKGNRVEVWRTGDGAQTWDRVTPARESAGMIPRIFFTPDAMWMETDSGSENELLLQQIGRDVCGRRAVRLRLPM